MSDQHHEIVIVKRHGGDHDDHHGGAWKIAFADFMTAMMAFFLVMWLIAANDKTRATVARYFNPVKLVDATVRKQGLQDPKTDDTTTPGGRDSADAKGSSKEMKAGNPPPDETPKNRETRLDATMRSNPLAALAEIAGPPKEGDGPPKVVTSGSAPVIGRQGGAAFRDPFAPPPPQSPDIDDKDADAMDGMPLPRSPSRPPEVAPVQTADTSSLQTKEQDLAKPKEIEAAKQADLAKGQELTKQKDQNLTKQLIASIKPPGQANDGPDVTVRRTSEGFLVSLTDTGNFSMFSNGSAVPEHHVVLMMERVAKVLGAKSGSLVIRGFTDNKPFRNGHYDNWNLSFDRAQAAHYMLVRGGLSDSRIASIQGFADHSTAAGLDPSSPLNRRIEILLKDDAT